MWKNLQKERLFYKSYKNLWRQHWFYTYNVKHSSSVIRQYNRWRQNSSISQHRIMMVNLTINLEAEINQDQVTISSVSSNLQAIPVMLNQKYRYLQYQIHQIYKCLVPHQRKMKMTQYFLIQMFLGIYTGRARSKLNKKFKI